MIVYEENTKRIVIPSGLGNLTGLMEAEAQAMYNSGRTDGYNEGVEDGKSIQDRKLTESVTFNENGEYDADYGYKKVIVDVDKQWDEGYESGYTDGYASGSTDRSEAIENAFESGYTNGYTSGYTDGVNIKAIKIEGKFPNAYSATSKVYYFGDFWINGVFVERLEITHERLYPLYKVYGRNESERGYRNFWISGFSASISTVQSIDLEVASNWDDIDLDGDEFDMTFNGIPIHITNWTRELIWTAQLPNQSPRTIYIYHWDITPITPTDYEIGYTDGYASGYTDGQASCPECSGSTDCSEAIEEAFESGYTNGYASGYTDGQADCDCTETYQIGYQDGYADGRESVTSACPMQSKSIRMSDIETSVTPDYGYVGLTDVYINAEDVYNDAYSTGYTEGYQSGYTAGQAETKGPLYSIFVSFAGHPALSSLPTDWKVQGFDFTVTSGFTNIQSYTSIGVDGYLDNAISLITPTVTVISFKVPTTDYEQWSEYVSAHSCKVNGTITYQTSAFDGGFYQHITGWAGTPDADDPSKTIITINIGQ